MVEHVLPPGLSAEEEGARLRAIVKALMDRSEGAQTVSSRPMGQLQHVVALEQQIRSRTRDLAETLDRLRVANARLSQAERAASRARNNLADALEAMGEGFALFDAADELTMWNSRFCAELPDVRLRLGPGLSFRDYVTLVSESPPLNLPDAAARQDFVARRLDSHRRWNVNFVVPLVEDQWIQVSEQRMASGGTAITQTDVTTMVRNEREERDKLLDEQARMVRATLDHIDQGVIIFDAKRRLAGWNRRFRELFAPPVDLLANGTQFDALMSNLIRRSQLGEGGVGARLADWVQGPPHRAALVLEVARAEGTVLELSAQAMPDRGFVISFTDLTKERRAIAEMHRLNETLEARVRSRTVELESARDAAERANATKSRFVASASHDLLQPLNAAKLFLASLAGTDQTPTQARLTERVQSAFGSVEQILGALLDISKFDIGAARAKIEPIPLAPFLDRLREEFTQVAQVRGLELRVRPAQAVVDSDPVYLKRILQNLLSNAIRYTERGRVVLGVRRRGGALRLEVWDTGRGIPDGKQAEIFKEFIRLEPESGEAGMGLGLAIVEQACALLGHPLGMRSQVGRGTMFSVTVPIARGAEALPPPLRATESTAATLENLLVLVVENDANVRSAMMGVLEGWGTSPIEAASLSEAQALIDDLGVAPDVVLADYHLDHNENGLDLIRVLRERHGDLPAVLITANHQSDLIHDAEDRGILLLNKPLSLRRLKRLLQELPLLSGRSVDGAAERGDHSYWLRPELEP